MRVFFFFSFNFVTTARNVCDRCVRDNQRRQHFKINFYYIYGYCKWLNMKTIYKIRNNLITKTKFSKRVLLFDVTELRKIYLINNVKNAQA